MSIQIYNLALLCIAFAATVAFVTRYTMKFRWWHTAVGSQLVAMSSCLGLFYGWALAVRFWPTMPAKAEVSVVMFTILTAVTVWRFIVFEQVIRNIARSKASGYGGSETEEDRAQKKENPVEKDQSDTSV